MQSCSKTAGPVAPVPGPCNIIFWAPPAAAGQTYEIHDYATATSVACVTMPGYNWHAMRPATIPAGWIAYGYTTTMTSGITYSYDFGSRAGGIYTYYGSVTFLYAGETEWFIH